MVDDDPGGMAAGEGVILHVRRITQTRAQEADDHIGRVARVDRIVRQAYPVTRRGLAGDGQVALGDAQRGTEIDGARNREHHGARRAFIAVGHPFPQRTRAGVVQVRDNIHIAPSATAGVATVALGIRKREHLGVGIRQGQRHGEDADTTLRA